MQIASEQPRLGTICFISIAGIETASGHLFTMPVSAKDTGGVNPRCRHLRS